MPREDYELLRRVGQGAQGIVWQARHVATGAMFAVKQISVAGFSEKERQRALQEVRVLATLQQHPHPNVMGYVESFVDGEAGLLCLVLEWSSEGTLEDRFDRDGDMGRAASTSSTATITADGPVYPPPPLTENEVWRVFLSVALALDHVHSLRVLHRDVKMANVFLHSVASVHTHSHGHGPGLDHTTTNVTSAAAAGGGHAGPSDLLAATAGAAPRNRRKLALDRVQLGDFGVSTVLQERSKALTVVGTPYYLSPELCMGKPYSARSDVWSLGVLLFSVLFNRRPFEASNYGALVLRIVQTASVAMPKSPYSPALSKLCAWCLQKREADRPLVRDLIRHPACLSKARELHLQLPLDMPLPPPCTSLPGGHVPSTTLRSRIAPPPPASTAGLRAPDISAPSGGQHNPPAGLSLFRRGDVRGSDGITSRKVRGRVLTSGDSTRGASQTVRRALVSYASVEPRHNNLRLVRPSSASSSMPEVPAHARRRLRDAAAVRDLPDGGDGSGSSSEGEAQRPASRAVPTPGPGLASRPAKPMTVGDRMRQARAAAADSDGGMPDATPAPAPASRADDDDDRHQSASYPTQNASDDSDGGYERVRFSTPAELREYLRGSHSPVPTDGAAAADSVIMGSTVMGTVRGGGDEAAGDEAAGDDDDDDGRLASVVWRVGNEAGESAVFTASVASQRGLARVVGEGAPNTEGAPPRPPHQHQSLAAVPGVSSLMTSTASTQSVHEPIPLERLIGSTASGGAGSRASGRRASVQTATSDGTSLCHTLSNDDEIAHLLAEVGAEGEAIGGPHVFSAVVDAVRESSEAGGPLSDRAAMAAFVGGLGVVDEAAQAHLLHLAFRTLFLEGQATALHSESEAADFY